MAFHKPTHTRTPRFYPTLSRLILEKLGELGAAAVGSFFPAKYPEARLWRSLLGLDSGYRFRRETFAVLLCRLRAQGLVQRTGTTRKSLWRLTRRGEEHLSRSEPRHSERPDGVGRLVIFDVPERERRKRDALRLELVASGFQQLQRSVWYGELPLPEDFLQLIDALALRPCVHIFSVRESGTFLPGSSPRSFKTKH